MISIHENYERKAGERLNEQQREFKETNQVLKFNNWIKSVLISLYSQEMCAKLEKTLDIAKGKRDPILNVLDIGCGHGQDILKWKVARVRYMVATDFSEECIKTYQERWKEFREPFRLWTVTADFTKLELYQKIKHAFYDIVSAQLCFHYMFKSLQDLNHGLGNILSNLLQEGVFIATIPDSYSILKKIKQKGKTINGYTYYGNKYFSLKFPKTTFTQGWGNEYGFYLQESIGSKDKETGQILYTNEWLISLDLLENVLDKVHGMKIQYTKNFLEFYLEHRDNQQYKHLFTKMRLIYDEGKSMDPDLWEIAHLYRVLVCRKYKNGKKFNDYTLNQRFKSYQGKEIKRTQLENNRGGDRGRSFNHYGNNHGGNRDRSAYHHSAGKNYHSGNQNNSNRN